MAQTAVGPEVSGLAAVDLSRFSVLDVPPHDSWLHPRELDVLRTLRFPKRRADWRLGRYTAKSALARRFALALPDIEVRAAADGAPEAFHEDGPLPVVISISHSGGWGTAAVADGGTALGCDIETIERRAAVLIEDFFTDVERDFVDRWPAAERDALITTIWSAKESALKATRRGLRADTRQVEVQFPDRMDGGWIPLAVCSPTTTMYGWAARGSQTVVTVVSDPPPAAPVFVAP